jgi:hypothetical protein
MDVSIVSEQTFLSSVEEVSAVVDGGLLAGRTAKDLGLPGVEMAVEVDDADGTVMAIDRAKKRESDGVIASKSNQAGQRGALFGWTRLISMSVWCAAQKLAMAFLNLL